MECPYRKIKDCGTICELSQKILKSSHDRLFVVNEVTCEECFQTKEIPHTKKINKVVSDILINAANKVIEYGGLDDCSVSKANKLIEHINNPNSQRKCNGRRIR